MPGCFAGFLRKSTKATEAVEKNNVYWRAPSSVPAHSHTHVHDHDHSLCAASWQMSSWNPHHVQNTAALPAYDEINKDDGAAKTISDTVDKLSDGLRKVSVKMHDNPELAWKEVETAKLLTKYMESKGFKVTRSVYGTETGWEAVYEHGSGGRVIGYNAEMDALPGIGHACGHNLIAIASLGAAVATAEALKAHDTPGKVIVLGTPAEEKDGGKIVMLKNGGYKEMDICLMSHPTPFSALAPMLAVSECNVEYIGKGAHAAGAPWEAVNALDAAVLAYNNISALRQQIHPSARVHGIFLPSPEWACNIIPSRSKLQFGVRHPNADELEKLKKRVEKCFEAAALASGCEYTLKWAYSYADMQDNMTLGEEFQRYMKSEQKEEFPVISDSFGSTDFGDVTYALPAFHPLFKIPVPPNGGNHTPEFAAAARTEEAHQITIKVAKGLAATAWRALTDSSFLEAAKKEYEDYRKLK